ncbi:hypothetical protein KFL_013480010 [Klebsormidium nitens]|uniref:Uncharacterized protein n=1 Tax=Klebsormidium nitens TaxID=105231 RepID=A0A1Y1IR59_KLENI|nr:hypothetical protein KFL_013480010 [Klebsormidium nitens]|eukprot:GAQ93184.1 hypothetical protein KFL_013480010 [Klebsormidium nitens]
MYHDLSAAGALVKVQGDHPPPAAEAAARQEAKDEEALAGEMAARKRAEFYFGKRFQVRECFALQDKNAGETTAKSYFGKRLQVLDWSPPEDDDDADEQMVYPDAACSHLTEDGDEGEYTAEYQVARFDRQWGSCYAQKKAKWGKKGSG